MPRARRAPEPDRFEIPDKLFFKIGEVCELLGVEAYVVRFWETEFPQLSPQRTDSGHRTYRRKDVELLFRIKELLYKKRMTIEGARKELARGRADVEIAAASPVHAPRGKLIAIRDGLREILTLLDRKT